MKKIVNGKSYNTGTSKMLMSVWNTVERADPYHTAEELYKTENGEYFIRGEGGRLTRYSIIKDGERVIGPPAIRVLTKAQAQYWVMSRTAGNGKYYSQPRGGNGVKID